MKINNIKESFKQNKLQVLDHLKLDKWHITKLEIKQNSKDFNLKVDKR